MCVCVCDNCIYIYRRNGYRRWKLTRQHEFKSWTNTLGKVWIQLFSLHLWVNKRLGSLAEGFVNVHTHTCIYICMYYTHLYIYIYYHPRTGCFVVSQLFMMSRHVGCLKLGSNPDQLYVRLSIIPLSQQANNASSDIIRHYVATFLCLHFYLIGFQSAQFIRRALHNASGNR